MKYLFFLLPFFLLIGGCNSSLQFFDSQENESDLHADVDSNSSSNTNSNSSDPSKTSYMQIAKDLFVAQQYTQAYQIASNLSEQDNVEAHYLLGYMTYYGYGIPADKVQGTKWISVSADKGYRPAIEALVLIKHGLTPDNKCSSVNLVSENDSNQTQAQKKNPSQSLKEGEVLITPKGNQLNKKEVTVNEQINRSKSPYTIQLMISRTRSVAQNFAADIKNKYPDLTKQMITYRSKNTPYSYGIGFSTFENNEDALIVLNNIKTRLNDSSLWIRRLDRFELYSLN